MDWGNVIATLVAIGFFALQLFLCLRVRRAVWRALPPLLCVAMIVLFYVLARLATGWEALGYVLLFVLSLLPLGGCLLAFGVWAIILLLRRVREKKNEL